MKTEAQLAAKLWIESVCPSAKVDSELREQLIAFRPEPGEATAMTPCLTVETIGDDDARWMVGIPVLTAGFWNSKEAKRGFIRKIGEYFAEQKLRPLVVYLIAEAWEGEEPKGSIDLEIEEVKHEIIIAVALTIDGRAGKAGTQIQRDPEGRISGYGEIVLHGCGSRRENGEPAVQAGILKPFFYGYYGVGPGDA